MKWNRLVLILWIALSVPVTGQNRATPLITQTIDPTKLVRLHGSVHPLAQARYDRGAVPDSFPAERVLLLLDRPTERETALRKFLGDVHQRGSASYHQWLTPQEYGHRFGPADSDVQTAASWLKSQGFNVAKVTKSKQFIEFSGTAGQLRKAFHTEVHQYNVQGETHYGNASEISIPEALAPLVRGVSPLNDFRAKPQLHVLGPAAYSRTTKKTTPQWTITSTNGNFYALAPEDFVTQYDLAPLYQAGVDGAGQTIGIINESNIDLSLVNAYQQLFGLSGNPTQVVIDGNDPGTLREVDVEAYLDVEVSGAVAPKATVNLYISSGGNLQDPLSLAAIRAIEDNQASVLSVSFGLCEYYLGSSRNQLWSGLWEQAAAQGQTVFVSSGDSGSAGCDFAGYHHAHSGLAVNGLASTPWNVAVGGTDFYYSDYAQGAPSAATLWNQTNDSNLGSLKAPLPEQPWNNPLGLNANPYPPGVPSDIAAGGGGASSCAMQSGTSCTSGYAKPSWQTGAGVPADGVRDLPDLSLFAANGLNLSAYPICAFAGECVPGANPTEILLVGGTSASSPAMAGIMALVNQKYGRQGQANFTLYPLAQQEPSAFHDVTLSSNNVPCEQGSPNCSLDSNGDGRYTLQQYAAGTGYDLASGLGSVDANVLVNNWSSITFQPTSTTLHLSSTSIAHGTPITVTSSVAPTSGSGTPSGEVAILTNSTLPSSQAQTFLALSGGTGSGSIDFFPGGTYQVSADYRGDGVFGKSTSSPVALTVTPENSNINFSVMDFLNVVSNGGTVQYDDPLSLNIQPVGVSAPTGKTNGKATGTATFTVDSNKQTAPLNGVGVARWAPPALAIGTHTASATFSGDASFSASSASPITFSVTKGLPFMTDYVSVPLGNLPGGRFIAPGGSLTVSVVLGPYYGVVGTAAPTGTVTVCLGPGNFNNTCVNSNYSQTAALASPSGSNGQRSSAMVTFQNLAAGDYYVSVAYNGDPVWQVWGLLDTAPVIVTSTNPAPSASATTLAITPNSISGIQAATLAVTVAGPAGAAVAPTGFITFYDNNSSAPYLEYYNLIPSNTGASATFTGSYFSPAYFWNNGDNQITAVYSGDTNYLPSSSPVVHLAVTQSGGDFSLTPQLPQITVASGGSGTVGLNLASLSNFNGVVTLTCAPSSSKISCGVNPSAPTLNGTATATLTINASAQAPGLSAHEGNRLGWLGGGGGFVLASVLLGGFANRKRRLALLLSLSLLAALFAAAGCGSGGSQNIQPPPPPPNAATYSVVVSATANGIIHNAKITVIVH